MQPSAPLPQENGSSVRIRGRDLLSPSALEIDYTAQQAYGGSKVKLYILSCLCANQHLKLMFNMVDDGFIHFHAADGDPGDSDRYQVGLGAHTAGAGIRYHEERHLSHRPRRAAVCSDSP